MFEFLKNNKQYIVIDAGSHKIAAIAFQIVDKKPLISRIEHHKSKGIKNNQLNDINEFSSVIKLLVKKISNKTMKKEFFCNITDPNLLIKKKKTDIDSGKLGISKKEIRKIYRKSINEAIEENKYLVHSNPSNFILDEKTVTYNPLGKKCNKLSLLSHNIFVDNLYIKKLNSSFEKNKINITKFFESGIASSISSLTKEEKNEGVVCIDIGADTSKIVVCLENNIIFVENLSLAGNNVTTDLSHGLQISHETAELTKIMYGSVVSPFNENIEINLDSGKKKIVNKNLIYGIIKPRYDEILEIIRDKVFDNINARIAIKSIVLTGGASKIFGIKNICENIFNRKTRVIKNTSGNNSVMNRPEFSTTFGMIKLVNHFLLHNQTPKFSNNQLTKIIDKIDNWIEESYA
ncbi:MAG: cell division protein FtsA [Rickettsiales bacterium]|nr:cell division protein FtsA [Rickettsiales bacterium]|tara:strand:- start:1899 stop:3113 length:1215 start_codon:yes stop_codon:yes gene_type:complete